MLNNFFRVVFRQPSTISWKAPRILMYHMVRDPIPGAQFNKLRVNPRAFENQIQWLCNDGWQFMTMSELITQRDFPAKTVAITFDDGFEDNYTNAFPILQRYNAKATLYLVIDRHNRDWSTYKKAHHDSGELMREPKLSNQQVTEMIASGIFEIGAHTLTHANLNQLDTTAREQEINGCKIALEEQFGIQATSFAYPFGIFSTNDTHMVDKAGFISAVTTIEGIDKDIHLKPFELRRIKVSGKDSLSRFKHRLAYGTK